MRINILIAVIITMDVAGLYAQDSIRYDINGNWEVSQMTPSGRRTQKFVIEQNDDNAVIRSKDGSFEMGMEGNKVNWFQTMNTPMGSIDVHYKGEIDDENNMSGIMAMMKGPLNGRSVKWNAVRKDEEVEVSKEKKRKRKKKKTTKKKG